MANRRAVAHLADVKATELFGVALSKSLKQGDVVYLRGDLGAGKTTLVRAILQAWGYTGKVKSPTYTLVEPHSIGRYVVYHFDLYRLSSSDELEFVGGRDYFDGQGICLVEWPEKGVGWLPEPSIEIEMTSDGAGRRIVLSDHRID